jgi:hypothetical protein
MNTESAVKSTTEYETLLTAVEEGLLKTDNKYTGLFQPFELRLEDKPVELVRTEIEKACDCSPLAEQYKEFLEQPVNEKGEAGKSNDFNIFLTMDGVMSSLELAMNNAFTLTPARVFCHSQVFLNSIKARDAIYETFIKYVNNLLTEAKKPNPK